VGYADDHAGNVYRMFNLRTRHVWITRDVKWIRHPTGNEEMTEVAPPVMSDIVIDVETVPEVETVPDDDDEEENDVIDHGAPADKANETVNDAESVDSMEDEDDIDPCILRQMKKLGGWFNPDAEEYIARARRNAEDSEVNVNDDEEKADNASEAGREVANATLSHAPSEFAFYSAKEAIEKRKKEDGEEHHFVEPATFREAYDHPDPFQQEKWCAAIRKEFRDMTNRGVWRKVKRSSVPVGRHCIKCKWVLKVK